MAFGFCVYCLFPYFLATTAATTGWEKEGLNILFFFLSWTGWGGDLYTVLVTTLDMIMICFFVWFLVSGFLVFLVLYL